MLFLFRKGTTFQSNNKIFENWSYANIINSNMNQIYLYWHRQNKYQIYLYIIYPREKKNLKKAI